MAYSFNLAGSGGYKLLTKSNPKAEKGIGAGYWTFILHLSPASLSGFNTCPMATAGCKAACLNTAGRGGIMAGHGVLTADDVASGIRNSIQNARIERTRFFFHDRAGFMALLVREIEKAIKLAERAGLKPAFRLNGTSDIRWETVSVGSAPNVMALFPNVAFYDYTKLANRKRLPANYHLTFSLADGNDEQARQALLNGMNVAAVFRDQDLVARYIRHGYVLGYPAAQPLKARVVSGDETDLRFLDPRGVIVALYAKGNARRDVSGFVRD